MENKRTAAPDNSSTHIHRALRTSPVNSMPALIKWVIEPELLSKVQRLDRRLKNSGGQICSILCNNPCRKHHSINFALLAQKVTLHDLENEYKIFSILSGDEGACHWLTIIRNEEEATFLRRKLMFYKDRISREEQLTIKEYQLAIINSLQDHLRQNNNLDPITPSIKNKKPENKIWLEGPRYYYTTVTIMMMMALGNFLGMTQLLSLIPGIPPFLLYGVSTCLAAVECFLHYTMMIPAFAFAFPNASKGIDRTFPVIVSEQLQSLQHINQQLTANPARVESMSAANFQGYKRLTQFFNAEFSTMKVESLKVSVLKKAMAWGLTLVNGGLTISGGFFWANSLLGLFGASLTSTPVVGWVITLSLISMMLHNNHTLRTSNVDVILNPEMPKYQALEENLKDFGLSKNQKNVELDFIQFKKRQPMGGIKRFCREYLASERNPTHPIQYDRYRYRTRQPQQSSPIRPHQTQYVMGQHHVMVHTYDENLPEHKLPSAQSRC
jgi:hypothetical protein